MSTNKRGKTSKEQLNSKKMKHSDAKQDKKQIEKMVKKGCLK
jgi:hypothetical protein